MTSIAKRPIPSTDMDIDRNGCVWKGHVKVPTTILRSQYGVKQLAIEMHGEPVAVWFLLSVIWYDQCMILPRDGNALNWSADNTIVLRGEWVCHIVQAAEVLLIWVTYCEGVPCWQLGEKTGLHQYYEEQFREVIKAILIAGIR